MFGMCTVILMISDENKNKTLDLIIDLLVVFWDCLFLYVFFNSRPTKRGKDVDLNNMLKYLLTFETFFFPYRPYTLSSP